jgi:hypothetical protein
MRETKFTDIFTIDGTKMNPRKKGRYVGMPKILQRVFINVYLYILTYVESIKTVSYRFAIHLFCFPFLSFLVI